MDSEKSQEAHLTTKLSTVSKLISVFVAPEKVFITIAQQPAWVWPLLIFVVVNLIFLFAAGDIVREETLAKQQKDMIAQGMDQEQIERALAATKTLLQYGTYITGVIFPLLIILVISSVFLFIGNVVMGGSVSFKRIFSVGAYTSLIMTLGTLVTLPIVLIKRTVQVSFSLSTLLFDSPTQSFAYNLFTKIEFFSIWWLAVYSLGLATVYEMKTQKMALAVATVYIIYSLVASSLPGLFS